jgi:hypothetical protein
LPARNDGGQPMMTTGNDEMMDKDNVQQGGRGQPTATRTMDNDDGGRQMMMADEDDRR